MKMSVFVWLADTPLTVTFQQRWIIKEKHIDSMKKMNSLSINNKTDSY